MNDQEILALGGAVFTEEMTALKQTQAELGEGFPQAVRLILSRRGRVITSGIGKSGIIARKIAATLSSTGTSAMFIHPVEGVHGDLGAVAGDDVALFLSKSGATEELVRLCGPLSAMGVPLIAVTCRPDSPLAKKAQVVLRIVMEREACPMNLTPTSSSTASLVLGDALAVALLKLRGFRKEDFALVHPAGSLGRRLSLKVADVMHSGAENPLVRPETPMRNVLLEMTAKNMGAVSVVDEKGRLKGLITDGDLRRALQKHANLLELPAHLIMTPHPIAVAADEMAFEAMLKMENRPSQIFVLPVVDQNGVAVGIVRLHDLVQAGL